MMIVVYNVAGSPYQQVTRDKKGQLWSPHAALQVFDILHKVCACAGISTGVGVDDDHFSHSLVICCHAGQMLESGLQPGQGDGFSPYVMSTLLLMSQPLVQNAILACSSSKVT